MERKSEGEKKGKPVPNDEVSGGATGINGTSGESGTGG